MHRAFISYARKDREFVRRLYGALEERGRKAWVDWEGIPPTDKWLATIRAAIDEADAFVFVISPDSVASEVCATELDHAIRQHKRLVPLVHREAEPGAVRGELAELNYVFARDEDSLDEACDRLVAALDTDLPWVRAHTRLLVRATEWERERRDASFTLRGRDLDDFEEWLAKSPEKEPAPTALQTEYLLASRRAVTRRQRIIATSVAVGLSLAVGLGTIAYFQNRERVRQETIAEARQLLNRADALRESPLDEVDARERLEESTRSAATALATLHGLGIPSLEADQSVRRSFGALPKWVDFEREPASIDASAFDPTGAYLALFRRRNELMVWDVARQQAAGSCAARLEAMKSTVGLAVSADGTLAATAVYDASAGRGDTEVIVWSIPDCRPALQIQMPGRRERVVLSGDGAYLAVDAGSAVRVWDVTSRSELFRDFADLVFAFDFSPQGARLATVERNRGERVYQVRVRDLGAADVEREWEHPERAAWIRWRPHALVVGGQNAWLYDPVSGALRHQHPIGQSGFALSPDGRFIAVSLPDYVIEIRDAATEAPIARTSHGREVASMAFAPDNESLTTVGTTGPNIRLWSFPSDGAFATLGHDAPLTHVRFASDGTHLYTGTDQGEVGWRLPRASERTVARSSEATASPSVAAAAYGIEVPVVRGCAADATTLTLQPAAAAGESRAIEVEGAAMSAVVSREGDRVALLIARDTTRVGSNASTRGGCARRLEIRHVATNAVVAARQLEPVLDNNAATFLRFIGDDRYLVVGVRGGVEILEAERLTTIATLFHPSVQQAAISDGARAATQGRDGLVRIWDVDTVNEIARIEASPLTAALALSPDGRWLATLEPHATVRLWAVAPDELVEQVCRWVRERCP